MEVILKEKQKFNQLFIWIPLLLLLIFGIKNFYEEMSISNLIPLLIMGIVILFLVFITLAYSIDKEGVSISFFPFFRRKIFRKEEIEEINIVDYSPISDFGGWGLRYGRNNTTAYNVKGNRGILFLLKDGKNYLIGSQLDESYLQEKLNIFFDNKVNIKKY